MRREHEQRLLQTVARPQPNHGVIQRRTAWGVQGGSKTAAGRPLTARTAGGHPFKCSKAISGVAILSKLQGCTFFEPSEFQEFNLQKFEMKVFASFPLSFSFSFFPFFFCFYSLFPSFFRRE
jgi:hypothetical protein